MSKRCEKGCCSLTFGPNVKFCTECGAKAVEPNSATSGSTRFCVTCGTANTANNKFCGNCGKSLSGNTNHGVVTEETSIRPSAVRQGAQQTTGVEEYQAQPVSPRGNMNRSDSTRKFYTDYLAPQAHTTGATSKKAAYVPPDHTARIPVIQEKADLCYEGRETFVVTSSTTTK